MYKKFVLKLLIFFITIITADAVAGKLLKKAYWGQQKGFDHHTTYSIEKTRAQLLVFGSSRAVNIFDPHILKNELGISCFNAGRVGQSVFYHYAVLQSVLKRYTPDAIVLSIDAGDFAKDARDYDKLSQLLPYYATHPELRDIIQLKSRFEDIKVLSAVYPYNSLLLPIVKGRLNKNTSEQSTDGYIPLNRKISGPLHKIDYADFALLDQQKINTYRLFIAACKRAGTKLFVVCPPYMVDAAGEDASLALAKKLANENGVEFFDHSADPGYISSRDNFADFRHLNRDGSGKFSRDIARLMKEASDN